MEFSPSLFPLALSHRRFRCHAKLAVLHSQVRNILDIGCGYGTFGAHLFSKDLLPMCIGPYEASCSQIQLTLERGLPAMVGSFTTKQLPFPSLSYDVVHCAQCGADWDLKGQEEEQNAEERLFMLRYLVLELQKHW